MSVREQIAEVLRIGWRDGAPFVVDEAEGSATRIDYGRYADVLIPLVDHIAKERAADEIRAIAHRLDDGGDEAIEVALGGAAYVHRVLCDTAHALDGKP